MGRRGDGTTPDESRRGSGGGGGGGGGRGGGGGGGCETWAGDDRSDDARGPMFGENMTSPGSLLLLCPPLPELAETAKSPPTLVGIRIGCDSGSTAEPIEFMFILELKETIMVLYLNLKFILARELHSG